MFNPHIVGYGHRVRCNIIAQEIRRIRKDAKIVFLDRKDDPLFNENWTQYKRVQGGLRRSLSLSTSSCLVEDGVLIEDFRRKWLSRFGKIVTILNPTIGPDFEEHRHHLEMNDLIIICYPKGFFPLPEMLKEYRDRIRWYGPVLNLPKGSFSRRQRGKMKINLLLSRGREKVVPIAEDIASSLDAEVVSPSFKSVSDYFTTLSETTVALTQGTTAVFECSHLSIPQLCLPINQEQLVVARKYEEAGALKCLPMDEATKESLGSALLELTSNQDLREKMATRAKEFAVPSGSEDIAKTIVRIAGN